MSGSRPAPGIIVINPNSSQAVTAGMDRAIENLRRPDGPAILCVTLAEGPPGIETDAQVRAVVAPLLHLVRRMDGEASAFVDACFSDPGLQELRRATEKPVFGIRERLSPRVRRRPPVRHHLDPRGLGPPPPAHYRGPRA